MMVDRHVHLGSDEERIPQQPVKSLTDSSGFGILKRYYSITLTSGNCRKDALDC